DLLLTDELQNNSLPKMKQFRELIQLFFARMDENNLQDKMKKEMNLFWETINGFISAYKNPSSVDNTLPYLTKLAILSTLGLSREAWGNDFKRYDEVNNDTYFNETVIALSKDEDPISKRALTLLFTTVPPVRNAVLELYKNDSFIEKRELLLKKLGECSSYLGPSSVRAIELAKNILNRSTLDLKTVSSTQFNEIYNAIKKSPEYNPSFLDHLNPNLSKFKENDKLKLEELKKGIHEARDDFERFKLIQDFIKTNPALLITQKIAPLILEQRTVISSQRISNL
ncbi:MAG: hypothetical protein JO131_01440, partial [Gammaproteobacteria bacterium]|nr:hypothetical protein [Gammaproteobacteria bacterium]